MAVVKDPGPFRKLAGVDLTQVERYAALGLTEDEIATLLRVGRRTLFRWKKNEEFNEALRRGKLQTDARVTERLYQRAMGGDVTAMIFWLKNRRPDLWRDRHDVGVSEPIVVKVQRVITNACPEE